jgi:PiT family inorganic phosphate transporter
MVGFGLAAAGIKAIYWVKIGFITLTWILSPIAGMLLSFIIYKFISISILHRKHPMKAAGIVAPFIIGLVGIVIFLSFVMKVLHKNDNAMLGYSILVAGIIYIIFFIIIKLANKNKKRDDEIQGVEGIFRYLQVITSSYVSLAHGSNDVANAIGPLAAIYAVVATGMVGSSVSVPKILLVIGGGGISLGVALWGSKVMKTVGKDITHLNNTRGLSVDFSTATTVLVSSMLGMPVSTTHTVVGAVIGVGLARGFESVNFSVLKNIIYSWILTIPIAALISAGIFKLIVMIFS